MLFGAFNFKFLDYWLPTLKTESKLVVCYYFHIIQPKKLEFKNGEYFYSEPH